MSFRLLIFVLTYNHEKFIEQVLADIPPEFKNNAATEILIIDDASKDRTCDVARAYAEREYLTNVRVARNQFNQGYGGNQKVGYRYAIERGFDAVVMLHGDGQYTPKVLPELIKPILDDPTVDCVLGVRFGKDHSPIRGGMPLYKFVGNRILTKIQNWLASANLKEWHTGYRVYSTRILSKIAFELNTNDFHFDTEIILQMLDQRAKINEFNIPTRYGDEICNVNGMRYAKDVLKASLKFRLQRYNLFYDIRYEPSLVFGGQNLSEHSNVYTDKFQSDSPHSICQRDDLIPRGSRILDIGCSAGYVADFLAQTKECHVIGVDFFPLEEKNIPWSYRQIDLENDWPALNELLEKEPFDVVLMLDVIEHLRMPELFLLNLHRRRYQAKPTFLFSTGNVAFAVVRFMLLFGHFNYGKKGILDVTHKRLFSLQTFQNLFEQTGFIVHEKHYFPFPFRELGFPPRWSKILERINRALIRVFPALFSYQMMFVASPLTSPEVTLNETMAAAPKEPS